jgi:cysteine desulfuration protein SufE
MTRDETQDRIIATLADLGDGLATYEHLVALGKEHAPEDARLRADEHALPGCQSQVWIRAALRDGRMCFEADSDSLIIRGILVLLLRVLNGRPPAHVAHADLYFLEKAGLSNSLSPSRANGVATIVKYMQQRAAALAAPDGDADSAANESV